MLTESLFDDIILLVLVLVLNLQSSYSVIILKPSMMDNEHKHTEQEKQYNDEPVFYCRRCLSLNIRQFPLNVDQGYCDDCGTVDVGSTSIEEWNKMYEEKYGHPYIVKRELKWPYWY